MFGDSFIRFLHEQEGKADRQKVLALSALVGSSVLAQLMFAGVSQAGPCDHIAMACNPPNKESCEQLGAGCFLDCRFGVTVGTCYIP
jgi:hypothetical protein